MALGVPLAIRSDWALDETATGDLSVAVEEAPASRRSQEQSQLISD